MLIVWQLVRVMSPSRVEHGIALDIKDKPNNKNSNLAHGIVYNSPILTAASIMGAKKAWYNQAMHNPKITASQKKLC